MELDMHIKTELVEVIQEVCGIELEWYYQEFPTEGPAYRNIGFEIKNKELTEKNRIDIAAIVNELYEGRVLIIKL